MMKALLKNHQLLKWLLIVAAGFLVVIGSVSLYMNIWVKPVLSRQIKALVFSATDQLYRIEFTGISVNCLTGDANLREVRLIPDTLVLKKLVSQKKAPNNIYYIELNKLSIENVHPWRVYRERKLNIDQVVVNHPHIVMVNKQYYFNEETLPAQQRSPYAIISKYLQEVRIASIDFKDVSFKYIDLNHAQPIIDSVEHFNASLKDWLIDAHSAEDTSRIFLLKDVHLQLDEYSLPTADSLYHVKASGMTFKASTGKLDIRKLALVPRYSEMDFGKVHRNGADRFDVQFSAVSLGGIDLPRYVRRQELVASHMKVGKGRISVFNDSEIETVDTPGKKLYPHQLLQQLPAKITIKKLDLQQLNISYAEYNPESKEKGVINFENTSGWITNISNSAVVKKKDPVMEAQLTTYLMGQGKLDAHFKFNLLAADGAFSYSGTLHGFNGALLNSITKPLAMLHIKSGMVKKLAFNIKANDKKATGNMKFYYHKLAVAVLKKEPGMPWYSRQGLLSFLANNLVMKGENPDPTGLFRPAKIDYTRRPGAAFFGFIWKTLFQGIRHSVGVTPEKEALVKAHIDKFEKMKVEREKRREARERRRAN